MRQNVNRMDSDQVDFAEIDNINPDIYDGTFQYDPAVGFRWRDA